MNSVFDELCVEPLAYTGLTLGPLMWLGVGLVVLGLVGVGWAKLSSR